MPNYDIVQVVHHATGILCGNTGSMEASQLYGEIAQRFDMTEEDFWCMMDNCGRFEAASGDDGEAGPVVVAKTSLRLCKDYSKNKCWSCQELHICKYYVYGNCRFGRNGKRCKLSHDIHSQHNQPLLLECTLHDLHQDSLFLLLLLNDPSLLPEVCAHYNKGTLPHGQCTFRESCTKLHLCAHHIRGDCLFGGRCQRPHAIDQHARRVLQERGLCSSGALVQDLLAVYRNRQRLAAPPPPDVGGADAPDVYRVAYQVSKIRSDQTTPAIIQTDERNICLHFLHKKCQFENQCINVHFNLPYKWEVLDGCIWHDLGNMEDIELAFCDPSASQSSSTPAVDFVGMTVCDGSLPVRRLSTPSSVSRPPHYRLTTVWAWYYEEHRGSWVEYGQLDSRQRTTSVSSRDLEQAYQRNHLHEVKLMRGFREYLLSFRDMYQRNLAHNTKRHVRRRPHFDSALLMQMAQ